MAGEMIGINTAKLFICEGIGQVPLVNELIDHGVIERGFLRSRPSPPRFSWTATTGWDSAQVGWDTPRSTRIREDGHYLENTHD